MHAATAFAAALALCGLGYLIFRIGTDEQFLGSFDHLLSPFRFAVRWVLVGTFLFTAGLFILGLLLRENL